MINLRESRDARTTTRWCGLTSTQFIPATTYVHAASDACKSSWNYRGSRSLFESEVVTCSLGCIFCRTCFSAVHSVCPNHDGHEPGTTSELKPAVGAETKTCARCLREITSGFACTGRCEYNLCAMDAGGFNRLHLHCQNGHTLIVNSSLSYRTCVVCEKSELVRGCECECHFTVCLDCEMVKHQLGKCPNGHLMNWGKFDSRRICFKCNKSVANGLTCEAGYVLCENCCSELRAGQEVEFAKEEVKVDEAPVVAEQPPQNKNAGEKAKGQGVAEVAKAKTDDEEAICGSSHKVQTEIPPCDHAGPAKN